MYAGIVRRAERALCATRPVPPANEDIERFIVLPRRVDAEDRELEVDSLIGGRRMPEREEEWIEGRSADDAEHEGAKEGKAVRALRPLGRVAREELHVLLSRVSERRHLKPAAGAIHQYAQNVAAA